MKQMPMVSFGLTSTVRRIGVGDSIDNNKASMEILTTLKPYNKSGIRMRVDIYEEMKKEIVDLLKNEESVSLQSFFEILHIRFVDLLGIDTGWYIYHVKLDLETRSVIKIVRSKERRNKRTFIKMATRHRTHKSRFQFYR